MGGRTSVTADFLGRDVSLSRTSDRVADKVEHDAHRMEEAGGHAGRGFFTRFRKGAEEGASKDKNRFQKILKKAVTPDEDVFDNLRYSFIRPLSTPLGLGIAAALTTALAGAIPAAIAAGLGGGLIAVGAFALKSSKILQARLAGAGAAISAAFAKAAQPLQGPFLKAINYVTGAVVVMRHQFHGLFEGLGKSIQPLARGFVGAFQGVMDGLQAAMPAIQVALSQVAERLPGLGRTIGGVMAAFSDNLPAIQKGIDLFFTLSEVTLNVAGAFLTLGQRVMQTGSNMAAAATAAVPWLSRIGEMQSEAKLAAATQMQHAAASRLNAAKQEELAAKVKASKQAFYEQRRAVSSVLPMFEGYKAKSDVTKGKILSNLREEVNAYKTWARDAQTLLKRGADPTVVSELSKKGPQYVHAFVNASDKELASMNKLMKARIQAAGTVAAIQGRIIGAQIGHAIERALENAFNPHLRAPSVRSPAAGVRSGKSVHSVVGATGGVVTRPTSALIGERGPEAVIPLNRTPGSSPLGSMGNTYNISVNVAPGSHPAEVGAGLVEAIQQYERRSGTGWRRSA